MCHGLLLIIFFYKSGFVLQISDNDIEPTFGQIMHITIGNNDEVNFLLRDLKNQGFNEMFQAFEVVLGKRRFVFNLNDIVIPFTRNLHYTGNGALVISPMSSI